VGDALSEMGINGPFLISQIVNFLVLFGLLTVLLWKPIRSLLKPGKRPKVLFPRPMNG
jgi:hypothetical protein